MGSDPPGRPGGRSEKTGRYPRRIAAPTVTPTKRPRTGRPGGGVGDPWRVIVLNDNHNTFQGVAFALATVIPGVSYERGLALADKIHNTGQAVVWSGHRERAEHYWAQLQGHGLTMAPLER